MSRKEPAEAKAAPEERDGSTAEDMDLSIQEVLAEYEAQIGALTGQILQKNLAIKKLKAELLKKNASAPKPG